MQNKHNTKLKNVRHGCIMCTPILRSVQPHVQPHDNHMYTYINILNKGS